MTDNYVYPNSETLINKFGIKDYGELSKLENEISILNISNIFKGDIVIKGGYNYEHLKSYHKYIFGDIYDWAGQQRTINIEKSELVLNGLMFKHTETEHVESKINDALNSLNRVDWINESLDNKIDNFIKCLSEVWMAHAFREGNTRTTITFFLKYAEEHGFILNNKLISDNVKYVRNALVASAFEDAELGIEKNFSYLKKIFFDATVPSRNKDSRKSMKGIEDTLHRHRNEDPGSNAQKRTEKER